MITATFVAAAHCLALLRVQLEDSAQQCLSDSCSPSAPVCSQQRERQHTAGSVAVMRNTQRGATPCNLHAAVLTGMAGSSAVQPTVQPHSFGAAVLPAYISTNHTRPSATLPQNVSSVRSVTLLLACISSGGQLSLKLIC